VSEPTQYRALTPPHARLLPVLLHLQQLIDHLDRDLGYAITHDAGWKLEEVGNYEEVKGAIRAQLEALRDTPHRCVCGGGGGEN
jgi:hypothetical protein